MTNELTAKLSNILAELQDVMRQRQIRIEELQDEIRQIERENIDLENQIQEMLKSF